MVGGLISARVGGRRCRWRGCRARRLCRGFWRRCRPSAQPTFKRFRLTDTASHHSRAGEGHILIDQREIGIRIAPQRAHGILFTNRIGLATYIDHDLAAGRRTGDQGEPSNSKCYAGCFFHITVLDGAAYLSASIHHSILWPKRPFGALAPSRQGRSPSQSQAVSTVSPVAKSTLDATTRFARSYILAKR